MKTTGIWGFYPIVPSSKWAQRLLQWGAKTLQLRVKDLPQDKLSQEIESTLALASDFDCQIIINDHWELALELGATYVHLGQEDLDDADIHRLHKANVSIGISTHSLAELDRALSFSPNYIALGPIYAPTGKQVNWAPQGLDKLQTWKDAIQVPLVAIGGITLDRASGVLQAGADSIAVIGDILHHKNPEQQVHRWLSLFEER